LYVVGYKGVIVFKTKGPAHWIKTHIWRFDKPKNIKYTFCFATATVPASGTSEPVEIKLIPFADLPK
jgi:hypothetical protein